MREAALRNLPPASESWLIAGGFHPGYSLLGGALRWYTGDVLRAEAFQILVLVFAGLGTLWIHVGTGFVLDGGGLEAFMIPGVLLLVVGLVGGIGYAPPAAVTLGPEGLRVTGRGREVRVCYDEIDEIRLIPARLYHRHYRRYAATRAFVPPHIPAQMLLILTPAGPLVLGLQPEEIESCRGMLEANRTFSPVMTEA